MRGEGAIASDRDSARAKVWAVVAKLGAVLTHPDGRIYIAVPSRWVARDADRKLWARWHGDVRVPFATREEALTWLAEIRAAVARAAEQDIPARQAVERFLPPTAKRSLFQDRIAQWTESMRAAVERGDRTQRYLDELVRWARPKDLLGWWWGRSIFEIDEAALDDFATWLGRQPARRPRKRQLELGHVEPAPDLLSAKTRQNVLAALHSFLGWLHRRRELAELPRSFPWPTVPEHAPAILSAEAQTAVLLEIDEARRGIFLACALMGLRPSEAVALRWSDYRDGWLSVSHARKGRRLDAREGGPKTNRVRRLPVPLDVAAWLDARDTAERRLSDEVLFRVPHVRGRRPKGPWSMTRLRATWYEACDRAGVERVPFYEGTKHTFATLVALRAPDREHVLQRYLGHADSKSTRRYKQLADAALVEVAAGAELVRLPAAPPESGGNAGDFGGGAGNRTRRRDARSRRKSAKSLAAD